MKDIEFVVIKILELLKIRFNKDVVINDLRKNARYPSMAALVEVLQDLSIDTHPVKIAPEQLDQLSFPCIALIKNPSGEFIILKNYHFSTQTITCITQSKTFTLSVEDFSQKWTGIAIGVARNKHSGEKHYFKNKLPGLKKFLLPMLTIGALAAGLIGMMLGNNEALPGIAIILAFIGFAITGILFLKESLPGAGLTTNFCQINPVIDCEKVLKSQSATILWVTNLGELGMYYFSFSFFLHLLSLFSQTTMEAFHFLFIVQCLGLPFIFYSLYQQLFKIKAICLLCMSVVFVYLTQYFLFLSYFPGTNTSYKTIFLMEIFTCLGITGLLAITSGKLKDGWKFKMQEQESLKNWFLQTTGIFDLVLLHRGRRTNMKEAARAMLPEINRSGNSITFIVNPTCIHCKFIAIEMDKIISVEDPVASLNLIFLHAKEISIFFTAIHLQAGSTTAWKVYLEYINTGLERIKASYPIEESLLTAAEQMYDAQMNWCKSMNIENTPVIFVNDIEVPALIQNTGNLSKLIENHFHHIRQPWLNTLRT